MSERPREPAPERGPRPPARPPRRILAWGGLGLSTLGVAKLTYDALSLQRTEAAWLPILAGGAMMAAAAIWLALDAPPSDPAAPEVSPAPTDPGRRARVAWAAVALLLVQALIPTRYYLGDDPFDERFSWRMFSAVRVYDCDLRAFDERDGRLEPVQLMREIHVGWVTTLRRNREAVMTRYLRWRCAEEEGLDGARLVNLCVSPEGRRAELLRRIDCASGELEAEGVAP